MKKILLHVGYHKTGTTWLQRDFFIEKYGYTQIASHEEVSERVVDADEFDRRAEPLRALIAERARRVEDRTVPVISSETLCGNPFYGGTGATTYARTLAEAVPDARVLITVREQFRMLTSVYMQYISRGGTKRPEAFFLEGNAPGYARFSAAHFRYHRLVRLYRDIFGPDNVLVLTQERMAGDLAGYLATLAAFAESPVREGLPGKAVRSGQSYPEAAAPLLRRINHLRGGAASPEPLIDLGGLGDTLYRGAGKLAHGPAGRLLPAGRVGAIARARFAGRFADSNRALAGMDLGIDLSGYEM
jgi:hypothetical protein